MMDGGGPSSVVDGSRDERLAGDRSFLEAFEAAEVAAEGWTHEAHLRAAFGLVRRYGPQEGLLRMRAGIFALNAAHGTATNSSGGYHETLTVAWFTLVAAAVRDTSALDFAQLVQDRPELLDTASLHTHYSPERLSSLEARARYVRPDRTLLPAV
ncbi:MAG: hypothetical protein AAF211_13095 [Myxococcota bacterium]